MATATEFTIYDANCTTETTGHERNGVAGRGETMLRARRGGECKEGYPQAFGHARDPRGHFQ